MGKGMNTFRVGFTMERAIPNKLTGSINQTYFRGLESIVAHITSRSVRNSNQTSIAKPH